MALEKGKFINDEDLCMYLLFARSNIRKETEYAYLAMRDLAPLWSKHTYVSKYRFLNFLDFLKKNEITFVDWQIFADTTQKELLLPPSDASLSHIDKTGKDKVLESAGNIVRSDFSLEDMETLLPFSSSFISYICFAVEPTKKQYDLLRSFLNAYIQNFVDGQLSIVDRNAMIFEKQKDHFFALINKTKMYEKYGKSFIFKHTADAKDDFFFVHTLLALEAMGYIQINRLTFTNNFVLDETEYEANIVLSDDFINEMNQKYKKENPNNVYESYDTEKCALTFLGKKIEISKTKSSDPARLMSVLAKNPEKKWSKDEIYDDLSYSLEEQKDLPSQKMYQAALKINDMVNKKTQIEDFLIFSTKFAQINPKYIAE